MQLCAHPIALHPVKKATNYGAMWKALEVRDLRHDRQLREWRAAHAAAQHADAAPKPPIDAGEGGV